MEKYEERIFRQKEETMQKDSSWSTADTSKKKKWADVAGGTERGEKRKLGMWAKGQIMLGF